MHHLINDKKDALKKLCEQYDVQAMYLFGSAVENENNNNSDIDTDILVSFKDISVEQYTDNYFNLHKKLEELFGRKIDLVTQNSLKNPYFIQQINDTKELLYAA